MRIAELTTSVVQLALRREFRHASATRRESANLLVRCRLGDGTEGWGEGVPRSYVTGETPEGALRQFAATPIAEQLGDDIDNWEGVLAMLDRLRPVVEADDPRGHGANALRCAIELSVLDAFGRLFGEPVGRVTALYGPASGLFSQQPEVRYSTTIGADSPRRERISALKMRLYGFRQCKVKVGAAGSDDPARLRRIRRWIGQSMDLRIDANEAWSADTVRARLEPLLPCGLSCVEQPVPHAECDALPALRRQIEVPIMLDESLTSELDARRAIDAGACDLLNIRLSKCGGFLASLRLAAMARDAGLGYQLGCHPGETGILSAAGRHWATTVRDIRYLEGSYDRHLLTELFTHEDHTFGYGGRARAIDAPGLGATINPDVFRRRMTQQVQFCFD